MRADRLVATLLFLQTRGRVTAAEVAAELEVSVATARRDLEALSTAGIPVYPQPGRGGGWALVGGARTDLSGLTATEAQALFLLLGPVATATPATKSALRKLLRALPQPFRLEAEAAAGAIVVDPARWGESDERPPSLVDELQRAVVRRRRIRLGYTRAGQRTTRLVDPWGLVDKDGLWYLVAGTERGQRTFRVDRIATVESTDEIAHRPDDFDLSTAWSQVVDEVERHRSTLAATVLIEAALAPVLRKQQGRHCVLEGPVDDGRIRARITAPTPLMIAQQLAGWGAALEVVEPESVRAELARLGTELVRRYAPTRE
ncbi:helix-turn-helix transcriptional regulator [Nocardia sp. CDC160]|uniref:helix-turn-helix transcriptional regulator n=1 Tax=Nocardia sp. CDC160 TaxID=3112166 RepID=UPI002DB703B3|nr:WYL domain-containing protein [Nocardia sp. CDC160]MEC3914573.1 WYL domain-containing protein [Nocardia sp. CDC160]